MINKIKQLFCKHEWKNLGKCRYGGTLIEGDIIGGTTYLWIQCFKCNKSKRIYLIKEGVKK